MHHQGYYQSLFMIHLWLNDSLVAACDPPAAVNNPLALKLIF